MNLASDVDLRSKVRATMVSHKSVLEALTCIKRCHDGALRGGDPRGLAILGESGTGKTRILDYAKSIYPPCRTAERLVSPFLVATVPPKPTVKALAERLLATLGAPHGAPLVGRRESENDMTFRLTNLLGECRTRMLGLDEFQQFVDQGTRRVQYHVTDWLKNLIDETGVSLIIAGLPYCAVVIEGNQQMSRRFRAPVILPRFNWSRADEREEFQSVLLTMQEQLKPFEFPDLASDEMAYRVFCATGGLMGRLANLLIEVTTTAIDERRCQIRLEDLDLASRKASYDMPSAITAPFSRQFAVVPNEDVIAQALRLGATTDAPDLAPASARGKAKSRSSQVLAR